MERDNSQEHDQESHTITYLEEYKIEKVIRGLSAALREPLELYFVHGSTVPEIANILNVMVTTIDLEIKMGIWIIQKRLGIDEIDKEMKAKIANVWSKIVEQEQEIERAESPSEEELRMMDERASPISSSGENNVIRGIWDDSPIEEPSVIDSKKRNTLWSTKPRMIASCIIIILTLSTSAVAGYGMYKSKYRQKIFDEYTEISLEPDNQTQRLSKDRIEETYFPAYMIAGYELTDSEVSDKFAVSIYTDNNLVEMYLRQWPDNVFNNTTNEDAVQEQVFINGEEGLAIKAKGISALIWYQDGYAFLLESIDSNLKIDDLIQIANSIEKQ